MGRCVTLGLAVFAILVSHGASAQLACTTRAEVLSHLSKKYQEAPVAMGLANNGGVIEVLTSRAGGSWTIIITMPNGHSCMVAAGDSWQKLPESAAFDPEA